MYTGVRRHQFLVDPNGHFYPWLFIYLIYEWGGGIFDRLLAKDEFRI